MSKLFCNTLSDNKLQDFYTLRLSEKQVDGLILLGGRVNETKTDVQYVNLLKNNFIQHLLLLSMENWRITMIIVLQLVRRA